MLINFPLSIESLTFIITQAMRILSVALLAVPIPFAYKMTQTYMPEGAFSGYQMYARRSVVSVSFQRTPVTLRVIERGRTS